MAVMYLDTIHRFKIIKSTKGKFDLTFNEVVYQECEDQDEVLYLLKSIQREYENNPCYQLLHGMNDRLSVCFRNTYNDEDVCFYSSDE
jgi:hypothetical protein